MRQDDPTVTLTEVTCIKMTEKALLCVINKNEVWIPKSHIHDDSEVFDDTDNSDGQLVISEWIANEKGLV